MEGDKVMSTTTVKITVESEGTGLKHTYHVSLDKLVLRESRENKIQGMQAFFESEEDPIYMIVADKVLNSIYVIGTESTQ